MAKSNGLENAPSTTGKKSGGGRVNNLIGKTNGSTKRSSTISKN